MAALTKGKNVHSHSVTDYVSNIHSSEGNCFPIILSCSSLEAGKDYRCKETLNEMNNSDSVPPVVNQTPRMPLCTPLSIDYIENNNTVSIIQFNV
jgi:hypothetical protein